MYWWLFSASQDGQKPIQVAAARGNREAVEVLFPLTSAINSVPEWTVDGILEYMQSETSKPVTLRALFFLVNLCIVFVVHLKLDLWNLTSV